MKFIRKSNKIIIMISSITIVNLKGDILAYRDYKNDV